MTLGTEDVKKWQPKVELLRPLVGRTLSDLQYCIYRVRHLTLPVLIWQ